MSFDTLDNAGAKLQKFCTDPTKAYTYLGPLQDCVKFRYLTKPLPVLYALAEQGKVFKLLSKAGRKTRGTKYVAIRVACNYLRLHYYGGKIIQQMQCHASEKGIHTFLNTIFNQTSDANEAIKFINNQNVTMLVTRRNYTHPLSYTDDVVALLSWTDRDKSMVYIAWAAMSDAQSNLPSPLAASTSVTYGLPNISEYPAQVSKGFTRLGLMTVTFDLMETGTYCYKKLKLQYIYLQLKPSQTASHTSPEPFWTNYGFDLVDELLQTTPLSETDQENPIRRHQHAFKTEAQTEVMAGLTELRDLQALSPRDGQSSDLDEGMDAYSRAHQNPCPTVPPLTDAAQLRVAMEA
jgi:hypothetical protein